MECLKATVERITFANEENGFSVIKVRSNSFSDLVTVVGNLASVNVGSVVTFKGEWKLCSKFGKQFTVTEYEESLPATVAGIQKYLGSGLIKGVGPVNAKRIVKYFKEDTLDIIDNNPYRLEEIDGIGKKRVGMIIKAWNEQKEVKNIMIFLQSKGVLTSHGVKIYKTYGNESLNILKENPYRLADDIWGIGFKTADKIAMQLGFERNSYERCRGGIQYVLGQLSNEGHCFSRRVELIEETIKMLEIEETVIGTTLEKMIIEKSVILDDQDAVYLPPLYHCEVGCTNRLTQILETDNKYSVNDIDKIINDIQRKEQIEYHKVQIEAVKRALSSKVMVLTGGPGTGKTTTTLAIIKVYAEIGASIKLAAPTGRAAKRLSETTNMEAKTIHRLLEFTPIDGYKRNKDNPLECDVLILDEISMIDVMLMNSLLKALAQGTILILVGDVDQLPSVGPGNVLKDIIDSNVVNVVRLTKIFRQAQGSSIITNAHRINKGQVPILKNNKDSDFFFMEEADPSRIPHIVKDLCLKRLPTHYNIDPIEDIQVLCPMQKGEVGAVNMNLVLQETLNTNKIFIKYGGSIFKLDDKVMQIKNNYDKSAFNGDIGRIIDINSEDKTIQIKYENNIVFYDSTELDEVVLAYATTVHKSQGSEYKVVIAPFCMQHYMLLQRNLLYTCVTRAKKIMIVIGTKKAIGISVSNNKITKRNSLLAKRLNNTEQ